MGNTSYKKRYQKLVKDIREVADAIEVYAKILPKESDLLRQAIAEGEEPTTDSQTTDSANPKE